MTNRITPALTPEEWAARSIRRDTLFGRVSMTDVSATHAFLMLSAEHESGSDHASVELFSHDADDDGAPTRHALAALALHEQPFGFTHEDIDDLRLAASGLDHDQVYGEALAHMERLASLATRIAMLLPQPT